MHLVKTNTDGVEHYVFLHADPGKDGYEGAVEKDIAFSVEQDLNEWHNGASRPDPRLGRNPKTKEYRVCKSERDLKQAGFEAVPGNPSWQVAANWSAYQNKIKGLEA